ncbi:MAG TPA: hypothetical protein VMF11_07985 [Candidatus Baltobacteraceae bacterium]|nr:hypothetical protein [Candidatus Baltobacteraceae bacterium]
MIVQRYKRRRGVVLTAIGFGKIDRARVEMATGRERTKRLTIAELSEMSSLDGATISRAISRKSGVDRQTLELLFQSLALRLQTEDYEYVAGEMMVGRDPGAPILIEIRVGAQPVISLLALTGTEGPAIVIHRGPIAGAQEPD